MITRRFGLERRRKLKIKNMFNSTRVSLRIMKIH